MSGGSYNYIFFKTMDEIMLHEEEVQKMADRLAGLGYAKDAAIETQQLLLTLRQFEIRYEATRDRLANVWKAVEWWDSNDSGEDGVKMALEEYRKDAPRRIS